MDTKAIPTEKHMRWACPLGCEGGFNSIPQTNEHLKKSHGTPRKGQEQGSITQEQMDEVREVTKVNRLKTDHFKMQRIHRVFNRGVAECDLELYAATRDDIKRMSIACAMKHPETMSLMQTFKRIAVRDVPGFSHAFPTDNSQEFLLIQACSLIPSFLRALGIDGTLILGDELSAQSIGSEEEPTSMHPPQSGHASFSSAVRQNRDLNAKFQVDDATALDDNFDPVLDGSTVVSSIGDLSNWQNAQGFIHNTSQLQEFQTKGRDWGPRSNLQTRLDLQAPGPFSYPFQNIGNLPQDFTFSRMGLRSKVRGGVAFNEALTNNVWRPSVASGGYKGARQIERDLVEPEMNFMQYQ